jgi:hypothetical protein
MKKVTTIVLNGFTNDSRVLKENLSLKKAGFDVEILALHKKGLKEFEIIEEIPVHRLNASKRNLVNEDIETNVADIVNTEDNDKEQIDNKTISNSIDTNESTLDELVKPIDLKNEKDLSLNTKNPKLSYLTKFIGQLRKLRRFIERKRHI